MLTTQKRKFALAWMSGMSKKNSAIEAGYSEKSASCKGSQLAKEPEVIAFIERKKREVNDVDEVPGGGKDFYTPAVKKPQGKPPPSAPLNIDNSTNYEEAIDFLKAIMNSREYEIEIRKDAAKAILPYQQPKKGEVGKKEAKSAAAKAVSGVGKFGAMPPPKLVVNNGKE